MRKKNIVQKSSFKRIIAFGVLLMLLITALVFTVFAEDPAAAPPSYFKTEDLFLNDEGKVQLVFDDAVTTGARIVFFTKKPDGSFTSESPVSFANGATDYVYAAGNAARATGVTLYAVVTTDYATINEFDGMPESEDADYVTLKRSVAPGDELVLQVIDVQPEPPFSFANNVVSLQLKKDLSGGDPSPYYVKAGDTVVVTLVLKGVKPVIDTSATVGGKTGTWTSEIIGDGADRNTKLVGTFDITNPVSTTTQNALAFEIKFDDSFGNAQTIQNGDVACAPVYLLDSFPSTGIAVSCVNDDPYDAPYDRIIYSGETMNITVSFSDLAFSVVSYSVNGGTSIPVGNAYANSYTIAHPLSSLECPDDEDTIPVSVVIKDLAGDTTTVSLSTLDQLTYYERSTISTDDVAIESPQLVSGTYYAKQGDTLDVTVKAQDNRRNVTIDIAGNTGTVSGPLYRDSDKRWVYELNVTLTNCASLNDLDSLPYVITGNKSFRLDNSNTHQPDDTVYLESLAVSSVTMASSNTYKPNMRYVVDGDILSVTVKFNHSDHVRVETAGFEIAGVTAVNDVTGLAVPGSNEAYYFYDSVNKVFVITYKLPEPGEAGYQVHVDNDQPVDVLVSAEDHAGNEFPATPPATSVLPYVADPVKYYAPLEITTQITSGNRNEEDGFWAVKNGEAYIITVHSNHLLDQSDFTVLGNPDSTDYFSLVSASTDNYIYKAEFTMNVAPLNNVADFTTLLIGYTTVDLVGQVFTFDPESADALEDGCLGRYYAPIEIADVVIKSSNSRDTTRYAKNEDTITITFTSNHKATIAGSIAEKNASVASVDAADSNMVAWTLTYTIQGGNLADLATVPFKFTVTDAAQNDSVTCTQESSGVTNSIKYYAPIIATARIKSSNARKTYAKNGDMVTVTYTAQHETAAVKHRIGSFGFTGSEVFKDSPIDLSLTIPANESGMPEGNVAFWIELLDPAGNTLRVDETDDESNVIYDRTVPEVRFAPVFNGATNQDVYLSIIYSDLYLDLGTVSCLINDSEQIPAEAKVNGAEPAITYTHQITVTKEGEYYCIGTISDLAGNKSQFVMSCSFILDKTNPSVKVNLNPNTFAGGFLLDNIFTINDPLLSGMTCTVTESSGVHEWALTKPMTTEGRKTVLLIAHDLAGNNSIPITCDIYIDTTAPQPMVRETIKGTVLGSGDENTITARGGTLAVSLATIHMGDEKRDQFTRLELLDENGKVVANLLDGGASSDDLHYIELPARGRYALVMEAVDGVGNQTGAIRYEINYRPTQWWLVVALSLLGLLAAAGIGYFLHKRNKENEQNRNGYNYGSSEKRRAFVRKV